MIAVIDADICNKNLHRFPNLASMKISSYYKNLGKDVELKTDYENLSSYEKIFISKVFIATDIPGEQTGRKNAGNVIEHYKDHPILNMPNVEYGGTGFFYDKAPPLPYEIEHCMPDYHLYDNWVADQISNGIKPIKLKCFTDYSIGFLTRHCFRKCKFCVNQNYNNVSIASPLEEFLDEDRPKILLCDDNFFGHPKWKELIQPVVDTGKRFVFKQGLDERLLTKDKIEALFKWKYDGRIMFAFDNVEDKDIIISKLNMLYEASPAKILRTQWYLLCGYDRNNIYDDTFWAKDVRDLFERIHILKSYGASSYVMRYESVYESRWHSLYSSICAWCNMPNMFWTQSFRTFTIHRSKLSVQQMEEFEKLYPDIARDYFDIKITRTD